MSYNVVTEDVHFTRYTSDPIIYMFYFKKGFEKLLASKSQKVNIFCLYVTVTIGYRKRNGYYNKLIIILSLSLKFSQKHPNFKNIFSFFLKEFKKEYKP